MCVITPQKANGSFTSESPWNEKENYHQMLPSVHHIFLIFWSKMLQNKKIHEEIEENDEKW